MHELMAATLDKVTAEIKQIWQDAAAQAVSKRRPALADDHFAHAERLDVPGHD